MKESWFNEQEKQLKLLTKEKEVITAKKRQYEVLKTIKNDSDNITKIEVKKYSSRHVECKYIK